MNIQQTQQVVEQAIKARVACMIWGDRGIGKSSVVAQIADKLAEKHEGYELKDIRLPQLDPVDIRGVLLPNKERDGVDWLLPSLWPKSGYGILFLDELEKAPRAVKAAALQLILDRKIGDYAVPPGWAIVAAGNPDDALSSVMGDALNNRMIHINMECSSILWLDWAKENGIDDRVVGFIHFRNDLLNTKPEEVAGRLAFPTPRSWHMASNLIKGVDDSAFAQRLASSAIGEGTALEFIAWVDLLSKLDMDAVFSGADYHFDADNLGMLYAVTTSAATRFRDMEHNERVRVLPHISKLWDRLKRTEFKVLFMSFVEDKTYFAPKYRDANGVYHFDHHRDSIFDALGMRK